MGAEWKAGSTGADLRVDRGGVQSPDMANGRPPGRPREHVRLWSNIRFLPILGPNGGETGMKFRAHVKSDGGANGRIAWRFWGPGGGISLEMERGRE